MSDTSDKEAVRVKDGGKSGPYIRLEGLQFEKVTSVLNEYGIPYTVDPEVFTFGNGAEVRIVDLGFNGDREAVQALLDRTVNWETHAA